MGRATAPVDVTSRRKLSRRDKKALEHQRREQRRRDKEVERLRWEDDAAFRLLRRFKVHSPHPLQRLYAYWQARRCGWDVLDPKFFDGTERKMAAWPRGAVLNPEYRVFWHWWNFWLNWQQRDYVSLEKRQKVSVDAESIEVTNSAFYREGECVK